MCKDDVFLALQLQILNEIIETEGTPNDSQNYGIELNEEEGPENKKPPAKNGPFERPSVINFNNE